MTAPHIERMQDELAQLADRLAKLSAFIASNPIFANMPADERQLMREQREHMIGYHDTLETRLDLAVRSQ
jgi:hypothetical protein